MSETAKEIKTRGTIERVARVNGKAGTEIKLMVPAAVGNDIPLGNVLVTITPVQTTIVFPSGKDEKNTKIRGRQPATAAKA